jgi:hypothetical protein
LVADTGADTHALSRELVDGLGLPTREVIYEGPFPADTPADNVLVFVDDLEITLEDGHTLPQRTFVVIDFPDRSGVRVTGVDGVLAPQLLATDETTVILDLPGARMRAARAPDVPAIAAEESLGVASGCDDRVDAIPMRGYRLPAALRAEGATEETPITLKPDTGRHQTVLFQNRGWVHLALEPAVVSSDHTRVSLGLGDFDVALTAGLGLGRAGPQQCSYDGLLGLDVLRRCVVVLRPDDAGFRCRR